MSQSKLLLDEIRSLSLKMDVMVNTLSSLEKKMESLVALERIGAETIPKIANSANIINRFKNDLCNQSDTELKITPIESDANPNAVPRLDENKEKEKMYRKYKNKYNYISTLKPKLPEDPVKKPKSLQNYTNNITQNDVNDDVQNDANDIVQINNNDDNDKTTFTINDVIQKKEVYEMLKCKLKNSPYDDPFYFINDTRVTKLKIKTHTGETIIKPVSLVAPLVVLQKMKDFHPLLKQNKKKSDKHFQSTSKMNSNIVIDGIHQPPEQNKKKSGKHFKSTSKMDSNIVNDSNSNNTTAKMNKRETRAIKTRDIKESINTNVKTRTRKRSLVIKQNKNEPLKKKKKSKQ